MTAQEELLAKECCELRGMILALTRYLKVSLTQDARFTICAEYNVVKLPCKECGK